MGNTNSINMGERAVNSPPGERPVGSSWGEIILAVLPFLLILIGEGLPMSLVESGLLTWEDSAMRAINTSLTVLLISSLLVVFAIAWRRKWPLWSATWFLLFCIPPLILAIGLAAWLTRGQLDFTISQDMVIYIWIPLIIAVVLYAVTRINPLRGLLAALPVIYFLWQPNMEFVPDSIELAIKLVSTALICLATGFALRRGGWRDSMYVILAVNLVVGVLFAFAGIYYGGMLPFSAPGPNPVEVTRSLLPQYLATSAILLGPLFAWRFRQIGRSDGRGGKIAYHLALAGLLLVIMANLAGLELTMQVDSASTISRVMSPLIIFGVVIYLVGVIWLYRYLPVSRTASGWAGKILLPLLPLGFPVILALPFITWKWPISSLFGIPLLWEYPHAVSLTLGLVWLGLSVWVITQGEGSSGLRVSSQEVSEAPALG